MKYTVAELLVVPVCTVDGSRTIESKAAALGGGCDAGGVTVMVAVRLTPLYVAVTTEVAVDVTGLVDTDATELLAPAGTVTEAGTVTAPGLLLDSATTAPPLGAAADSVTVPVAVVPPSTLAGLRLTDCRAGAAGGGVDTVQPASRTFTAVAEPSFTSTLQSAGDV